MGKGWTGLVEARQDVEKRKDQGKGLLGSETTLNVNTNYSTCASSHELTLTITSSFMDYQRRQDTGDAAMASVLGIVVNYALLSRSTSVRLSGCTIFQTTSVYKVPDLFFSLSKKSDSILPSAIVSLVSRNRCSTYLVVDGKIGHSIYLL